MIDRIVALDLDARTVKAHAKIPPTSTIFEGHFPGHPLMPGVLLIESMAQTSGWLIIGLTLMFLLAPATRFGYFIYPASLLLWLEVSQFGLRQSAVEEASAAAGEAAGRVASAGGPA